MTLIIIYIVQFLLVVLFCLIIKNSNLLKTVYNGFCLYQLFLIFMIPFIGIWFMGMFLIEIGESKQKIEFYSLLKKKETKMLTVHRKKLQINYVENIPCYVVEGKIYQLPKLEREDAKLYLVTELDDKHKKSRVEITYEE